MSLLDKAKDEYADNKDEIDKMEESLKKRREDEMNKKDSDDPMPS